jgi:phosphoribosylformimino-5-aminoimidazole carboxamide ribotide isomerase
VLIIPAIDLLNGECVRLLRGDYSSTTHYSKDPAAIAKGFEEAGARLIHIVDLDSARGGVNNRKTIRAIRKAVACVLEVGGGVRSRDDVVELMDCGIGRVIIGTALITTPEKVASWISVSGCYAIAGLDALERKIKIQGWTGNARIKDTDAAYNCWALGFKEIIYTNIDRDGTLAGPDIASTLEIASVSRLPVILSGGIGSASDVKKVSEQGNKRIKGVITGKALYEEKISLKELISLYQNTGEPIMEKTARI